MAAFRFSRRAEVDLLSIGDYTRRVWGEAQADHYIGELEACCQLLAGKPGLGRPCASIRPGLRRMEHGKPRRVLSSGARRDPRRSASTSEYATDRHAIDDQADAL